MRIKSLQTLLLISTISILTLVFSSTLLNAQKKVSEKEKYGGTLTVAIPYDTKTLDPRYFSGNSAAGSFGYEKMYDRLVDYSEGGAKDVNPMLAESWKRVDDVTWLVSIRKGVKFHNGKELTAEDVWKNIDWKLNHNEKYAKMGWKRPLGRSFIFPIIKKVEIIDKYTLKFILTGPYPAFVGGTLNWLCQGIIDPDIVEKFQKQATHHPVGTGPFKFVEWVSGDHIIIERFDEYWGGKAYLDRVIFRPIPDGDTRVIALEIGEVDVAGYLPLNALPRIKKDPRLGYFLTADSAKMKGTLWFNLRRWPMNQLKFRQAVAMGVDWGNITKTAFPKGTESLCRSFLKGSWAEDPQAEKLLPSYNPKKARDLIKEVEKEAGKPLPKEIDGMVDRDQIMSGVLMMAAEQLKKIGVNLKVRVLEKLIIIDIMNSDPKVNWEVTISGVKGPTIDPSVWASEFYSKTPRAGDRKGRSAYKNPEFDNLVERGEAIFDRKERKRLYQQMEKIVLKDLPAIPLFNLPVLFGYNKRVHDLRGHDSEFLYLKSPWNNVWVEKGKK